MITLRWVSLHKIMFLVLDLWPESQRPWPLIHSYDRCILISNTIAKYIQNVVVRRKCIYNRLSFFILKHLIHKIYSWMTAFLKFKICYNLIWHYWTCPMVSDKYWLIVISTTISIFFSLFCFDSSTEWFKSSEADTIFWQLAQTGRFNRSFLIYPLTFMMVCTIYMY